VLIASVSAMIVGYVWLKAIPRDEDEV